MNTNTHNTHNPFTGDGVTNTHNPLTGDKTGPHPPPGTNPVTGRTKDGNLGRNEQQPPETHHTGATGTGAGVTSGTNTHNTHNPLTGDKTGPHPPPGTNPVTGRANEGHLGRNDQPTGYTGTTGTHTGAHTGAGTGVTSGTNTHNMHNPLTGDGVTNTHNPMTGDKTGPHPPPGTNPVTGRTNDGNLGRHEQHPAGYTNTTGVRTGAHTTGAHTGTHTGAGAGAGITSGTDPATGRTGDGNLGRNEQQPAGYTSTTGTGTHDHTIHDTTRGAHTTGAVGTTGTGAHPTSTQTSGGGAKALVGKVEASLGSIIKNPEMHARGVQKQEDAQAAKAARQEATHGGADVRH